MTCKEKDFSPIPRTLLRQLSTQPFSFSLPCLFRVKSKKVLTFLEYSLKDGLSV